MRNLFFALVGAFLALSAHAKGYAPVVTPTSTGVSVAVRANAQGAAALARIGNNVNTTSSIIAGIAKGVSVEAVVTGAITGASRGGAMGAAIGAVGAVAIGALPWFVDAALRSGVKIAPDGSTQVLIPPCTSGCLMYTGAPDGQLKSSAMEVCTLSAAGFAAANGRDVTGVYTTGSNPGGGQCRASVTDLGDRAVGTWGTYSVPSLPEHYEPSNTADAIAKITASDVPPTVDEVQHLIEMGFPPDVQPESITGPASVDGPNTQKLGLDGSNETETCKFYLEYFPSNIKAHPECTVTTVTPEKTTSQTTTRTTVNADGSTDTKQVTTTTTTPASTVTVTTKKDVVPGDQKDAVTCGLPGTPACKMDETGTPEYKPEVMALDKAKLDTDSATHRDTVKGTADKGMFSSWSQFFTLPSLRSCEPLQLPVYSGYTLPTMDICPGAEWLRGMMAFVWAVAGFAFCWSCVEGAI